MKNAAKVLSSLRIVGKGKFNLSKFKTNATEGIADKQAAKDRLVTLTEELVNLQMKFYAQSKNGLLLVFQAMDTGGKDGVIRRVFGPLNPQGVGVTSFKRPTGYELSHDYLWRIHPHVPAKGMIRIFNRSHYEDVLVHRVHKLISKKTLENRYRQLNDFERYLAENNVVILKFFLHISKDEQKERLESRLQDPEKGWKFEAGDLKERGFWDRYQEAYEAMIDKCSTPHAPWFVVPADSKWYRDWIVAEIVHKTLKDLKPEYPMEQEGLDDIVIE
jgi:polyphosphate:nucleotide phosphotransferase, PPK2 family